MSHGNYKTLLTCSEVLKLLKSGAYRVLPDEGIVLGRSGKPLAQWPDRRAGRKFVRLYADGKKRKSIAVSKLIWMAMTGRVVPNGFEIHHWDEDVTNDKWMNLFCFYKDDHRKLHNGSNSEEIPF